MKNIDCKPSGFVIINNPSPAHFKMTQVKLRKVDSIAQIPENSKFHFESTSKLGNEPNSDPLDLNYNLDIYLNRGTKRNEGEGYRQTARSSLQDVGINSTDRSTLPSMFLENEISQPPCLGDSSSPLLLDGFPSNESYYESIKTTDGFMDDQTMYDFSRGIFELDGLYETSFGSASTVWSIDNDKPHMNENEGLTNNYQYHENEFNDTIVVSDSRSSSIECLTMNGNRKTSKRVEFSLISEMNHEISSNDDTELKTGRKGQGQGQEIKPKAIPERFKLLTSHDSINLTIMESSIQCLSIMIDYHGYTGSLTGVPIMNKTLKNEAVNPQAKQSTDAKLIELVETNIPAVQPSPISALWQRIKYSRDISALLNTITNIVYKKSSIYDFGNPYEPQYYRFELDDFGELINESKCGMCAYCEKVKFLPFKNSSYLSHLTLEHGIFSNNYLTPEGIYYGRYLFTKNAIYDSDTTPNSESSEEFNVIRKKHFHKPRVAEAVACPACFEIIEVGCWKMKSNPLLSYFRHFKKHHKSLTNKRANFQTNPLLTISKRGRKLQVVDS